MTFFYDLNKRLADIATPQQLTEDVAVSTSPKVASKQRLDEKWDKPTTVAPSEKGKYKGKTKAELKKQYDRLKASGPHKKGSPEFGRMRELAFAIRAKSDWGKVDEAPNEGNEFSGALAKAKATGAKEFEVDGKTYDVKEASAFPGTDEYKRRYGTDIEAFRLRHAPSVMKDPEARKELSKMDTEHERLKKMRRGEIDPDEIDTGMPAGEKRGRGRPKGSKRAIGAKGPTGRSKLMTREQNVAEATGNLASIVRANQRDVDAFMRSGDLSDGLYNVLFDYYMDEMPYGTAKARTGDPYEWISDRFHDDMSGGVTEDYDKDEYDEEGEMAKSQSRTIEDAARELQAMLGDNENMPEWVQKKINLAKEYIDSARDYLKANRPEQDMDESALQAYLGKKKYGEQGMKALQKAGREGASKEKMAKIRASHDKLDEVEIDEKAVSKAQRAAAGIAHAAKKGEIPKSELRGASKEMAKMPAGELKKFAKTKEKGLPEKVREEDTETRDERAERAGKKVAKDIEYDEKVKDKIHGKKRDSEDTKAEKAGKKVAKDIEHDEKVDETTTAGSVAPAVAAPGKKSGGGMQFGKGIYDSMNREVEDMIAESMSINMSDSTEGGKSLTVTASDEDALKLAAILKMAGLGSMRQDSEASGGCDSMEEAYGDTDVTKNQPDYPTNTETSDDALQYAGGLNKPKLQVNPNNKADNPLAMKSLGHTAHTLNLGDEDGELRRIREMAGIREAAKPDFPDIDDDGDEKESIAKAAKDKEKEEEVNEAVASSLWDLYKRIA